MTALTVTAEDTRRTELKTLARTWHETGSEVRQMRLRSLTHPSLAGWDLDEAWDTLQGDLALLDGLNAECWAYETHWSDVEPALCGPDRHADAVDIMQQRVSGALDLLIRGKPGTAGGQKSGNAR